MTREDALEKAKHYSKVYHSICVDAEGFWAAVIEALSQEPCIYDLNKVKQEVKQEVKQGPCDDAVSRGVFEQVMWERDIAIEQLHELGYELGQKIEPCDDAVSRDAVLQAVSEGCFELRGVYGRCEELINALPSVNPQKSGKWIPVSEKLPKVGISVLVSDADSDIYFTHITRDSVFFDEWGNKIKGVIAWMPLPEPYEPQEVRNECIA